MRIADAARGEQQEEFDGKLVRGIIAKHADAFTCLRIVEADGTAVDERQAGGSPGRSD
jgi:hypothetical protein